MNPADKRLLLGIGAFFAVLVLVVAIIAFPKVYRWMVEISAQAIVDDRTAGRPDPREMPSLFDIRIGDPVGRVHVTLEGMVRNNGPAPISFVKVRCAIRDMDGQEHDAAITFAVGAEGLPPTNRRGFDLILDRPPGELWEYSPRCEIVDYRSGP